MSMGFERTQEIRLKVRIVVHNGGLLMEQLWLLQGTASKR
jgi:hypothetical protein